MPDDQVNAQGNADKGGMTNKRSEKDAAIGKTCLQHPWRSAYAVCAYCHKPFCFEDIIEHGSHYYCLNDMERVPQEQEKPRTLSYGLYLFSGIMLMLAFLVFVYSSYAAYINMFSFLFGNIQSITTAIYESLQLMMEGILMLALFVDAIMILMQSRSSVYAGIALSMASVVLFGYSLLIGTLSVNYASISTGFIECAAFVSLVMLLYIGIKNGRTKEMPLLHKETVEDKLLRWPDSGRF